jgi:DNA-binding transcriptional ArsR family regulator
VNYHPDLTLQALADPARRQVVELLAERPRKPSDIAAELGLSRPVTSRHLRTLRETGLVKATLSDRDARERAYQLQIDELDALRGWLDGVQARWQDQLDAFAAHVAKR